MTYLKDIIFIFILSCLFLSACKETPKPAGFSFISGATMGTTYNISYLTKKNYKPQIDSLLKALNDEVSTYEPHSLITEFNQNKESVCLQKTGDTNGYGSHFLKIYNKALEVYTKTNGLFDPTIMPLVNYWGFGYKKKVAVKNVDRAKIEKMMESIGSDKVSLIESKSRSNNNCNISLVKNHESTQLDYSAIAKGYGVDLISLFLENKGITDYKVEIGGELRTNGLSPSKQKWKIGINVPDENAAYNEFYSIAHLGSSSMASSGNYRIFHEIDGKKYGHEINPLTGYPEKNNLLGTTVISEDCMSADAYATAFMVMGLEASLQFCKEHQMVEALFLYGNEEGSISSSQTDGFDRYLSAQQN